ncbi:TrfB-related DNA-binding protein [Xanthomonas citri]|uniref:TrfB-related DNA-binding protein n=1 Tax=Xanthomonas citri TaxID=346 RepID=UPI001F484C20|nr:TrfB-related DNA-binding protein [Xanthomonas citri]
MQFQTLANFRLTEDEFEQIASKKKMMERSLQVAREIVVEGRGVTEAAEQSGMSKQQALEIKRGSMPDIWRTFSCRPIGLGRPCVRHKHA